MTILLLIFFCSYVLWITLDLMDTYSVCKHIIFNKLTPLDKELGIEDKIKYLNQLNQELSKKIGIRPPPMFVQETKDEKKPEVKEDNAIAVNWVFYTAVIWERNTIQNLSLKGLGAVLAHELWHIKDNHSPKSILLKYLVRIVTLLLFIWITHEGNAYPADGDGKQSLMSLIFASSHFFLFIHVGACVGDFLDKLKSRKQELECDKFAGEVTTWDDYLDEAYYFKNLEKKGERSLFRKIKGFFTDTHPSWNTRIEVVGKHLKKF